ncbi:unnamed protein product [Rotaria magnacalcarata]
MKIVNLTPLKIPSRLAQKGTKGLLHCVPSDVQDTNLARITRKQESCKNCKNTRILPERSVQIILKIFGHCSMVIKFKSFPT